MCTLCLSCRGLLWCESQHSVALSSAPVLNCTVAYFDVIMRVCVGRTSIADFYAASNLLAGYGTQAAAKDVFLGRAACLYQFLKRRADTKAIENMRTEDMELFVSRLKTWVKIAACIEWTQAGIDSADAENKHRRALQIQSICWDLFGQYISQIQQLQSQPIAITYNGSCCMGVYVLQSLFCLPPLQLYFDKHALGYDDHWTQLGRYFYQINHDTNRAAQLRLGTGHETSDKVTQLCANSTNWASSFEQWFPRNKNVTSVCSKLTDIVTVHTEHHSKCHQCGNVRKYREADCILDSMGTSEDLFTHLTRTDSAPIEECTCAPTFDMNGVSVAKTQKLVRIYKSPPAVYMLQLTSPPSSSAAAPAKAPPTLELRMQINNYRGIQDGYTLGPVPDAEHDATIDHSQCYELHAIVLRVPNEEEAAWVAAVFRGNQWWLVRGVDVSQISVVALQEMHSAAGYVPCFLFYCKIYAA